MTHEPVAPRATTFCCKKHAQVTALICFYKKHVRTTSSLPTTKIIPVKKIRTSPKKQKTRRFSFIKIASIKKKLQTFARAQHLFAFSVNPPHFDFAIPFSIKNKRKKRGRPPLKKSRKIVTWFSGTLVYDYLSSYYFVLKEMPVYFLLYVLSALVIFYGTSYVYTEIFKDLPQPEELVNRPLPVSSKILDRSGNVLYRIYEEENRTIIPLNKIPISLIQATIAIEDQDFYNHYGFSLRGILRAAVSNQQSSSSLQGGSTITQQLVKNRLLTPERTFQRKVKELILSVLVENTYSKNEILEMYLNQAPYGGSTYGIEEAAQKFFGKSAAYLTLAESALIAGLPASPTSYSPYGPNPELAKARQVEVLRRMTEEGFITLEQAQEAAKTPLEITPRGIEIEAPHFVMYVRSLLADRYGENLVTNGGLIVTTTLDLPTQKAAQEIVSTEVANISHLKVTNGAALVTEPKTGAILAMVGSVNYFDFENDGQVNVTLRPRQPGSSIKPLTYALALEAGKKPSSYIDDSPITYNVEGSPPYSPQNYDGKYHGRVTLREALASSYNIPAVKLLAETGVSNMLERAPDFGISTWQDTKRFGLSLTLGGGEVLMTQMAELYGTFANEGAHTYLNPIVEVKTYDGEILYQNICVLEGTCQSRQVLSPAVAYQITDILKDNVARSPAFGLQSTLTIPGQEVAVKTGTTNNLRDNWTIGYTAERLVAVWVGNNNNTSMSYVASGITGASPIWNKIMRTQLSEKKPHTFVAPTTITFAEVCTQTSQGMRKYLEAFIIGSTVEPKCGKIDNSFTGTTPIQPILERLQINESATQTTRSPNR